jgi:predicted nucleic acid-binding protein
MPCLETSFVVDVLQGRKGARPVMEEIRDEKGRPTVTPVTASELWVGTYFGSAAELEAAQDLLDSLAWLDFSRDCARRAGRLQADLVQDGSPLGIADCMIASMAMEHGETLVTRDGDFERVPDLRLRTY